MDESDLLCTDDVYLPWREHFSFEGLDNNEFRSKFNVRSVAAREITEAIKAGKRPALELATGGGKTIVAFLAAALLGARTLFLAPTKPLIAQHDAFLKNEMGHRYSSRVIDGNTKEGERIWDCARDAFVFATPEVVLAAIANGATIFANFTLVVFDEVHHARGGYAYVEIGHILREYDVPYCGMSASLGGDELDIRALVALMHFDVVRWYTIGTPERHEEYVFIPTSPEQQRTEEGGFRPLERKFKRRLMHSLVALRVRLPTFDDEPLEASELEYLTRAINSSTEGKERALGMIHLVMYKKLLYAYRVFMTDGYEPFLLYIRALRERGNVSDKRMLADSLFRKIITTAECYRGKHPKEVRVIKEIQHAAYYKKHAIAFFANKGTATLLAQTLAEDGMQVACVFGGRGMGRKKQLATLAAFSGRKIDILLATSVIEEGMSIAEVDLVINVHVPNEVRSRRQRGGRTARKRPGKVLHLVMDHPFDLRTFFAVHAKLRALEVSRRPLQMEHDRSKHKCLSNFDSTSDRHPCRFFTVVIIPERWRHSVH